MRFGSNHRKANPDSHDWRGLRVLPASLALTAALALTLSCTTAASPPGDDAKDAGNEKGKGANVAAVVGGQPISLGDVDERASKSDARTYQQLYDTRQRALVAMINDRLLDEEAAARSLSREDLIEKEVAGKLGPVTDDQISSFFEENKARMAGRPIDQVKDQIREFLVNRNRAEELDRYLTSLRDKAGVEILLEPPRVSVQVAANDPAMGPPGAPITIVEFSDFQ